MRHPKLSLHFQPLSGTPDQDPLLFDRRPPGRKGTATLFVRTRRTLRKRLGVHDLGQIDGLLQDQEGEVKHEEMKTALARTTKWRYLFPPDRKLGPEKAVPVDFRTALQQKAQRVG